MKIKAFLMSAVVAAMAFASCSDNLETPTKPTDDGIAYLSIRVETYAGATRGSAEDNGAAESDLKSLYLLTFDNGGNIVGIPGGTYYIPIASGSTNPDAVKVSSAATRLLVIANPGTKLLGVINGVNATSNFASLNVAITAAAMGEITDDVTSITKGFAMINSGDDTGKNAGDVISDPLIDLTGKIQKVSDYESQADAEAAAKAAAEAARVTVPIERLASKLELKTKTTIDVLPAGATFEFGNWTVDGINTTFFPYAEKTILGVTHVGTWYKKNFYTKDPNFTGTVGAGISYTKIDKTGDYSPILVAPYTWMAKDIKTYAIENTMAAAEQKYGNATRIVIKGKYYPVASWTGDWFNFAGKNYETLALLQAAYTAAGAGSNLETVCDKMFDKIDAYATAKALTLTGTDFSTLTEADLALIPNGGEVIKDGTNDVIRWYQDGLSYYYYEIRHDNETTKEMDFGKYGIVRNNWYSLTLGKINGAGTPWYPNIEEPGPGDPDPTDPIDESAGYLGITISVAPWIIWNNEIGV